MPDDIYGYTFSTSTGYYYFNSDEEEDMTYGINQKKWLSEHPEIKIGSKVMVLTSWESFSQEEQSVIGWKLNYPPMMDNLINNDCVIINISSRSGFQLSCESVSDPQGYWYPYCCLEERGDISIIFPDETEQKIENMDEGFKIISKLVLKLDKKEKIWIKIGERRLDALNIYNPYLQGKPVEFLKKAVFFSKGE